MNASSKTKLCWNCEGSAPFEEENCPSCGVYLGPASPPASKRFDPLTPPYQLEEAKAVEEIPPSPYVNEEQQEEQVDEEVAAAPKSEANAVTIPLALLLAGSVFFLFGITLALFSENGTLTLHWNGDYWSIYLVLAAPLLFFGWRSLQQLES